MTDKSSILKAFNNHFFDFLDDIIRILPENKDISASKNSFDMIKRANPTAIIKAWYKFIYQPYFEVINRGEIEFFFEKDYNEDVGHLANSQNIMSIIDTLRQPVKEMSDTNKEHTMKYLQNLSKLSNIYSTL
jgi:hypothetical protein|uniref:Uncharacterized protein n=1 Tax=viral metagenome TaxID=1070528 RepID=A0A6C0HCF3_9ZZZZ